MLKHLSFVCEVAFDFHLSFGVNSCYHGASLFATSRLYFNSCTENVKLISAQPAAINLVLLAACSGNGKAYNTRQCNRFTAS